MQHIVRSEAVNQAFRSSHLNLLDRIYYDPVAAYHWPSDVVQRDSCVLYHTSLQCVDSRERPHRLVATMALPCNGIGSIHSQPCYSFHRLMKGLSTFRSTLANWHLHFPPNMLTGHIPLKRTSKGLISFQLIGSLSIQLLA